MSYELSFSPEFFFGEAEPYDGGEARNSKGQPTSVWRALHDMPEEDWCDMCEHLFPGVLPKFVEMESVMDKVRETNTCSNLSVPVRVWIDPDGYYCVEVYDDTVEVAPKNELIRRSQDWYTRHTA